MIVMRTRRRVVKERMTDRVWSAGNAPRRIVERTRYYRWRLHHAREEFGAWLAVVLARPRGLFANRGVLPIVSALMALLVAAGATVAIVAGGSGEGAGKFEEARALAPQQAGIAGAGARERAANAAERAHERRARARRAKAAARRRAAARSRAAAAHGGAAAARAQKVAPAAAPVTAARPKATTPSSSSPPPRSTPQPVSKPAPAPARPPPAPARPAPAPARPAPHPAPK